MLELCTGTSHSWGWIVVGDLRIPAAAGMPTLPRSVTVWSQPPLGQPWEGTVDDVVMALEMCPSFE